MLLYIVGYFFLFSPPILLGFAWARFLERDDTKPQPKWRRVVGAVNLFAVSDAVNMVQHRVRGSLPSSSGDRPSYFHASKLSQKEVI